MHRRDLLRLLSLSTLAGAAGCTSNSVASDARALEAQPASGGETGAFDVDLVLTAAPGEMPLLPGAPTRVWRFTGE